MCKVNKGKGGKAQTSLLQGQHLRKRAFVVTVRCVPGGSHAPSFIYLCDTCDMPPLVLNIYE